LTSKDAACCVLVFSKPTYGRDFGPAHEFGLLKKAPALNVCFIDGGVPGHASCSHSEEKIIPECKLIHSVASKGIGIHLARAVAGFSNHRKEIPVFSKHWSQIRGMGSGTSIQTRNIPQELAE